MSRKIQFAIQGLLTIAQAVGEPLADHLQWSNTAQILFHTLVGAIQLQLGAYAQQFNVDGTKPPMANVQVVTETTTDILPRKENT